MRAGQLDRPIVIEQATYTQDSIGQEIPTWRPWLTTYAKWEPTLGSERFQANGAHSIMGGKFTIRYKTGIDPTMRILFDGKIYAIKAIAELTRRQGLEIVVDIWL